MSSGASTALETRQIPCHVFWFYLVEARDKKEEGGVGTRPLPQWL